MIAKAYIDMGEPLVSVHPETLTDGSVAWNLHIRGGEVVHCPNERAADDAFACISKGLQIATSGGVVVL